MFVPFGHWILESLCVTSNAYTLNMHCSFETNKRIWLSTFYVMNFTQWWPFIGTVNSLFPDRSFVTYQHLNFSVRLYFDRQCRARTMKIQECIRSFQKDTEKSVISFPLLLVNFFPFGLYLISFYFSDRDLSLTNNSSLLSEWYNIHWNTFRWVLIIRYLYVERWTLKHFNSIHSSSQSASNQIINL